jgi:cobalt-zinc-cadmium efflux system membrane fusion protein
MPAEAAPAGSHYVDLEAGSDPSVLSAPARVSAAADSRSQVTAVVRGQIVETLVRVGQRVEAGDPIVRLRCPELLQAAAGLHALQDQIEAHRERLELLESLTREGLARSESTFELRAQLAELQTRVSTARTTLQAAGLSRVEAERLRQRGTLTLRAPTAGIVASLDAPPGGSYEPYGARPLAEIVGPAPAWIAVELTRPPPAAAQPVFEGVDGRSIPLEPTAVSQLPLSSGSLRVFYRPAPRPDAGTELLIEGLSGRVRFALPDDAHQVPLAALHGDPVQPELWVLRAGESLRVPVQVLGRSATNALVRGELRAGDRVRVGTPATDDGTSP